VAIQFRATAEERVRCYANNALNHVGGTHLLGFFSALMQTLKITPAKEDHCAGLTAVVSVQHPDPQFVSATKSRLNNPEVEGIVAGVVREQLGKFLEENPKDAARIMEKVAGRSSPDFCLTSGTERTSSES
jgi:DNA gyrase subunit B